MSSPAQIGNSSWYVLNTSASVKLAGSSVLNGRLSQDGVGRSASDVLITTAQQTMGKEPGGQAVRYLNKILGRLLLNLICSRVTMTRLGCLQAFGLSENMIRISTQQAGQDVLWFRCADPTWYAEEISIRDDNCLLWSCCDSITACRKTAAGIEFFEFDIEEPDEMSPISSSEQGLLFYLFVYLIEDQDWRDEATSLSQLRYAAREVGFLYLEEALTFQESNGSATDFNSRLTSKTRSIVG